MSDPVCYYVHLTPSGWAAQFDGVGDLHHFPTREKAIAMARAAAETRWQVSGIKSCVKIQEVDGSIINEASFGP